MHLILIYLPDNDEGDSPFAGIEVALITNDREAAHEYLETQGGAHPECHYMLTTIGDAVT